MSLLLKSRLLEAMITLKSTGVNIQVTRYTRLIVALSLALH